MAVTTYRQLEVWQRAIALVEVVYMLAKQFPTEERFGLTSQIQRAAVSIPANIAEGWGRSHRGDFLHHLSIAKGSLMEVETHLILAVKLGFIAKDDAKQAWGLTQQVGEMITGMITGLQKAETGSISASIKRKM